MKPKQNMFLFWQVGEVLKKEYVLEPYENYVLVTTTQLFSSCYVVSFRE